MTSWPEERTQLLEKLQSAEAGLKDVLASPAIWHRVRQASIRALEQIQVARQQLEMQDHPL